MAEESGFQVSGNAAELYEKYAVPYILGPWAPELVELAALKQGERVLDLACGTGVVARLAAPRVGPMGQVTGIDLNAQMLAVARTLPVHSGPAIAWVQASATAMELPDASIDAILCQQGLQFFPDELAALSEMHRVLLRGGRVVLSVWKSAGPYNIAVADALEQHVGLEPASKYRANRVVPDAGELHRLFVEAGFRDVHIRPSAMTIRLPQFKVFVLNHLSSSPVAAAVAALTEAQREALASQVSEKLCMYADGDGVAVPEEINIVMAHS